MEEVIGVPLQDDIFSNLFFILFFFLWQSNILLIDPPQCHTFTCIVYPNLVIARHIYLTYSSLDVNKQSLKALSEKKLAILCIIVYLKCNSWNHHYLKTNSLPIFIFTDFCGPTTMQTTTKSTRIQGKLSL